MSNSADLSHQLPNTVIVVLGCKVLDDGIIPPQLRHRIETAGALYAELRQANPDHSLLVIPTGGAVDTVHGEAAAIARVLKEEFAVPSTDIIVEDRARTTADNVEFVSDILASIVGQAADAGSRAQSLDVIVVTSAFHLHRGVVLLQESFKFRPLLAGISVRGRAAPDDVVEGSDLWKYHVDHEARCLAGQLREIRKRNGVTTT